jgi:ribonuclease R
MRKVFDYLTLKSGHEIESKDFWEKFSSSKEDKSKKKKHKNDHDRDFRKKEDILRMLEILSEEKLIHLKKKTIAVVKPFKLVGKISISKRGDGFVKLKSGREMFVPADYTEGSINGDIVEVSVIGMGKRDKLEGEVKDVIRRGRTLYRLQVTEIDGNYFYGKLLDMPGEPKEGVIRKKTLLADVARSIKEGEILIVKLKDNSLVGSNIFEVSFIRYEGGSTRDKDLNRILMKYDYEQYYPDHIPLEYADDVNEKTVVDWGMRVDLRNIWTATIDGNDSKDFDDAISIEEEGDVVRFYVHIADVSYYVKQGSALDEEAYKRATSVYLVDTVIPMLPPILSEDLCSLVANKNRLAFTVEMLSDYNGRIFSAKYYKSIIKVDKRYTYDIAEEEILTNAPESRIVKLMRLANGFKKQRIINGRIDLNLKELYIKTEENGDVKEVKFRDRLNSHILIEELMLSANMKVAEFLYKKQAPVLYRIHEPMNEEKLETLNAFMKLYGLNHNIESTDYSDLQLALKKVEGKESEKIFNYFLLRSFMQAYYGSERLGHWGLGFHDYSHFTSPIRRYPDLVVHRVLDAVIHSEENPYLVEEIDVMGVHTSDEERKAADAERDLNKLKSCRYLQSSGKTKFIGIINGIKPQAVFVELEDWFGDAVISIAHFTDEYELVLPNEFSFISKKYSKTFFLGQKIDLELESVNLEEIKIYMKPIIRSTNVKK